MNVNEKQIVKLIEEATKAERPVYLHRKLDDNQVDTTVVSYGWWAIKLPSDSEVFDSRKLFPRKPELGETIRINNGVGYWERVVEGRDLFDFLDKDFEASKPAQVSRFKYTPDFSGVDKNLTIFQGEGTLQAVQDRFLKIVGKNHDELSALNWRTGRKFGPIFVADGKTWSFVAMPVQINLPELKALEPTEQKTVELTEYNVA